MNHHVIIEDPTLADLRSDCIYLNESISARHRNVHRVLFTVADGAVRISHIRHAKRDGVTSADLT